jgi:hypothetical protein
MTLKASGKRAAVLGVVVAPGVIAIEGVVKVAIQKG